MEPNVDIMWMSVCKQKSLCSNSNTNETKWKRKCAGLKEKNRKRARQKAQYFHWILFRNCDKRFSVCILLFVYCRFICVWTIVLRFFIRVPRLMGQIKWAKIEILEIYYLLKWHVEEKIRVSAIVDSRHNLHAYKETTCVDAPLCRCVLCSRAKYTL